MRAGRDWGEVDPAIEGVCGVGVMHPMRAGAPQFVGCSGAALLDEVGRLKEEPLHDVVQARCQRVCVWITSRCL